MASKINRQIRYDLPEDEFQGASSIFAMRFDDAFDVELNRSFPNSNSCDRTRMNLNSNTEPIWQTVLDCVVEKVHFTDRIAGVVCPACRSDLLIATLNNVKVAACSECNGILVQLHALAVSITEQRATYRGRQVVPRPINAADLKKSRCCPSCANPFETHSYCGPGNVIIDSCIECKLVWLDRGELTSIVTAPGSK